METVQTLNSKEMHRKAQESAQSLNLSPRRTAEPLEFQRGIQKQGQNEPEAQWEAFPTSEEDHPDLLHHELNKIRKLY